jgi:UDP-3-O-[3-hydroxymyristoyl] glucosamine N-acyltransferase
VKRSYELLELAHYLGAVLVGDPKHEIRALATLQNASRDALGFIANPAYKKYLATTQAGALLIHPDLQGEFSGNKLVIANPYIAYARASSLFSPLHPPVAGVHPTAVVGANCSIAENVSIGANAVIGDSVNLLEGVVVGPGCYVGDETVIGKYTRLAANVSIYHGVSIGENCILHSGCVIGADGFGFAPDAGGWLKIHQLGGVVIGNNVEIGACTCIDRGALDDTWIADGVIIDNQVQIAHNVRIGKNSAIAGHSAIAGSTTIGANCTISGAVAIVGHITLADKVHITARSLVSASITEAGSYSSGTPLASTKDWRKNAARFRQLDSLATRLIKLERK